MSHEQKVQPHVRLTPEELRNLWLEKSPAEQYLLCLLRALKKPGFEIVIKDVPAFCAEWKLSVSTFYRVKASLTLKGKINEVITGAVRLTVTNLGQSDSQPWESDSQPWESDSQPWESDSQPWENKSREPLTSTAFNDSPTLSQLFLNSSNNLLTTNREEEDIERKRKNTSTPEIFDCEILEEPEPLNDRSYPLTIHTPIVVHSENKTVPAAARGKKAIETDHVARLCAIWNEHKATLWASIRIPPNPTRSRTLLKFVESCGSIDTAIEYLTGALTYMRDDEFWASKKLLTIENVLSNGKVPANYEKYLELQANPAIVAVAEKLKQMQEPKSWHEIQRERDWRAGEQAVINRMKLGNPGEFEPEELAEYRAKYPNEFEAVSY